MILSTIQDHNQSITYVFHTIIYSTELFNFAYLAILAGQRIALLQSCTGVWHGDSLDNLAFDLSV